MAVASCKDLASDPEGPEPATRLAVAGHMRQVISSSLEGDLILPRWSHVQTSTCIITARTHQTPYSRSIGVACSQLTLSWHQVKQGGECGCRAFALP